MSTASSLPADGDEPATTATDDPVSLVERARRAMSAARVIFVCALRGPSGGRFLYTLLDNHPQIYAFPFKLASLIDVDTFGDLPAEQRIREVIGKKYLFDTSLYGQDLVKLGDAQDQHLVVDARKFNEIFTAIIGSCPFNLRNFVLSLAVAYNFAQGNHPRGDFFVFYTHELSKAVRLCRAMGTGSIIATHRHPVNLYGSGVEYTRQRSLGNSWRAIAVFRGVSPASIGREKKVLMHYRLGNLFDFYATMGQHDQAIALVLLEELHKNPRRSMSALADHLRLRFDDTLLTSTIAGMKWWGKSKTRLNGFSNTLHTNIKTERIGAAAERKIFFLTKRFHEATGYSRYRTVTKWLDPVSWLQIDRVVLQYYGDAAQILLDTFLRDEYPEFDRYDKLYVLRKNLSGAMVFPLLRVKDAIQVFIRDRTADVDQFKIINPLSAREPYFRDCV